MAHELASNDLHLASTGTQECVAYGGAVAASDGEAALTELLQAIGGRLQQTRRERGLSQAAIARMAGLDRAYLSSIEHGKQNITVKALLRLAASLGTSLESLMRGY